MNVNFAKSLDRLGGAFLHALLRPARAIRDWTTPDRPLDAVREIAVVKFWGVGNAALILPVLADLRRRYPGARLTVVTLAGNETVYRAGADRVLTVRLGPVYHAIFDLLRCARQLRRDRIDIALDMEQFVRASQVLLFLARVRQVAAFDTAGLDRASLADVRIPYDHTKHMAEGFLDLARAVGVSAGAYQAGGLSPVVACPIELDERPLAILHPGSGDNFPGRRWPTRRFGQLARKLVESGARVVVTGTPVESALVQEVCEAAEDPLEVVQGSLDELIALLAAADVLVSNDTGPVHLAAASGTPVVALYGPNTPLLYGPLSANSRAFYNPPPCSPCITNFNYKSSRCLNPICIRSIPVDEVAAAVCARLAPDARSEQLA